MPTLWIDNQLVTAAEGSTVLEAARSAGIHIPSLCYLPGFEPFTSCLVCLVRVDGESRLVPSCAYPVRDGMRVESDTDEVHEARRTALELLLSDHAGDCLAPCHRVCPLHLPVPKMLRLVKTGMWAKAAALVRHAIALPGATGWLCHHPCEAACRRRLHDDAVSIRELERLAAAETDADRFTLPCEAPTGKRVAVVGAGPAGLTAAVELARAGHKVVLFDRHEEPGGSLQESLRRGRLPEPVWQADLTVVRRLPLEFRLGVEVGCDLTLTDLRDRCDAVLLALGTSFTAQTCLLGLPTEQDRPVVDPRTFATAIQGVFAAGGALRKGTQLVRVMAQGKQAAGCVRQYLAGMPPGRQRPCSVSILRKLSDSELKAFLAQEGVSQAPRVQVKSRPEALGEQAIREEAARCLHCDCRRADDCRLRECSEAHAADGRRFRGARRSFEQVADHPLLLYEPGKCIACGRCVAVAEAAGEEVGLTFLGRGFPIRVSVPFGEPLSVGLRRTAVDCARACPTGALCLRDAVESDR